jgi:hypothetical protein
VDAGDIDAARSLYTRLLSRTQHVKVWLAFAEFEAGVAGSPSGARALYERAYAHFKAASGGEDGDAVEARQQRAALLDAWRDFEAAGVEAERRAGGDARLLLPLLRAVEARAPRAVKKFRAQTAEEYADFFFPDDDAKPAHLKLLEAAARWKAGGGGLGATAALAGGGGEAAGGAAAAAAASGGGWGGDENEVDLDAAPPSMADVLAGAVQAGRKRGREGGGEGGEGSGEGEEGGAAPAAPPPPPARDENELDLDAFDAPALPPPPPPPPPPLPPADGGGGGGGDGGEAAPPPRRRALALPQPKNE